MSQRSLFLSIFFSLTFLATHGSHAAMHTELVPYKSGASELEGFVAYDDANADKPRPAVLLVHDWMGKNDFIKERAQQVARLGYVAFAVDLYGKGRVAKDHKEAAKLAGVYWGEDRAPLRQRMQAAFDAAAAMSQVDKTKIAAVGYCFGGMAALELARSGADLRGTATLHGLLGTPKPASTKNIKGAILVMTGDLDPMVPAKQVMSFAKEMRDAKADWQVVTFGGAMHAFSVPSANSPKEGMAYHRRADMRSWSILVDFFAEVLGETVH